MDANAQRETEGAVEVIPRPSPGQINRDINEVAKALSMAQGEFDEVFKGKTADAGKYEYNYADLADVLRAVRAPLTKAGLALTQLFRTIDESTMAVETLLLHSSGQYLRSVFVVPSRGGIQAIGSAITYARRYSALAILGVHPTNDDDDGAAGDGKRIDNRDRDSREHSYQPTRYRDEERGGREERGRDDRGRDDRGGTDQRTDRRDEPRTDRSPPAGRDSDRGEPGGGEAWNWRDEAKRLAKRIQDAVTLEELEAIQTGQAMEDVKRDADDPAWKYLVGRLETARKAIEIENNRRSAA